jgi:hypothetical protein
MELLRSSISAVSGNGALLEVTNRLGFISELIEPKITRMYMNPDPSEIADPGKNIPVNVTAQWR